MNCVTPHELVCVTVEQHSYLIMPSAPRWLVWRVQGRELPQAGKAARQGRPDSTGELSYTEKRQCCRRHVTVAAGGVRRCADEGPSPYLGGGSGGGCDGGKDSSFRPGAETTHRHAGFWTLEASKSNTTQCVYATLMITLGLTIALKEGVGESDLE